MSFDGGGGGDKVYFIVDDLSLTVWAWRRRKAVGTVGSVNQ